MNDLDALLCQPLEAVADEGFTQRVVAARRRQVWGERLALFGPIVALTALLPFLPVEEFTSAAVRLTPLVAQSGPIAFALAVLALTLSLDARLREAA